MDLGPKDSQKRLGLVVRSRRTWHHPKRTQSPERKMRSLGVTGPTDPGNFFLPAGRASRISVTSVTASCFISRRRRAGVGQRRRRASASSVRWSLAPVSNAQRPSLQRKSCFYPPASPHFTLIHSACYSIRAITQSKQSSDSITTQPVVLVSLNVELVAAMGYWRGHG